VQLAELRVDADGPIVTASIDGEIDMSNAVEIANTITRCVANHVLGLVLDLGGVTYLDSAAIHAIFELRERLSTRGQHMRLVLAPGATTSDALTLAGVPQAVPVTTTADEARQAIRSASIGCSS
jgi:anti-anti-sigma factor